MDDIELLREFASHHSEEAFRTVVERHIDFVYAVALRQLSDPHAAEEVTQAVFIDLARKAAVIPSGTILSGWLFRAARFAAAKTLRSELRRQRREWEATQMEPTFHENKMDSPWEQMEPALNEALEELSEQDRSAVLLRFFEKKALKEVGERLGLNEEAAKKRVARAVEKLRLIFQRRGIATSSAVLLAALSAQTAQAAPVGLAASIATTAVLKGTVLTASTVTLGKGILNLMAISKLNAALAATAALLLVGGTTTYVIVHQNRARPPQPVANVVESADDALAMSIIDTMNSQSLDAAPPMVFLRVHDGSGGNTGSLASGGKLMGKGVSIRELLAIAYGITQSRLRMARQAPWPAEHVDYIVSLPSGQKEALQQSIREKFGLIAKRESRQEDIYVLTARAGEFPGLQPAAQRGGGSSSRTGGSEITFNNATVDSFARAIERIIQRPIINETGLRDRYDIFLTYAEPNAQQTDPEALKKALGDQLGFELKPDKRDLEILLVQNVMSR
jgi:uncharacterized protein (TIGR03435 family)